MHKCTLDDRGLCEECILAEQIQERKYNFQEMMNTYRIPDDLPEFPTPYEMGKMENGIWD